MASQLPFEEPKKYKDCENYDRNTSKHWTVTSFLLQVIIVLRDKIAIKICHCTTVTPVSKSNSARVHTPQILQPQLRYLPLPSPLKNSGTAAGMNIKHSTVQARK